MAWPCRLKCGVTALNGYLDDLGVGTTTRREDLAYLGKCGFT